MTLQEIREKDKYIEITKPLIYRSNLDYVNVFETINLPKFVHFEKPKSKFHK